MHIKIKDYNVKFKNSLKGYFKTRSKGFSHEENLHQIIKLKERLIIKLKKKLIKILLFLKEKHCL